MGVLTDYFIAGSDTEAAGTLSATGGPEQAGMVTLQLKGVDPVVNLATLEEILTGTDSMGIISEGTDPVADGGSDDPAIDDAIEDALAHRVQVDVLYDERARRAVDGLAVLLRFRR